MEYDRVLIENGEYLRFLTSSLVHLGYFHLLINLTILAVSIALFFIAKLPLILLIPSLVSHILTTNMMTYYWSPETQIQLGFSSALYGFLIFILVVNTYKTNWLYILPSIVVIARVLSQQSEDFDVMYLQEYIHAPVFAQGHLYGLFSGLISITMYFIYVYIIKRKQHIFSK